MIEHLHNLVRRCARSGLLLDTNLLLLYVIGRSDPDQIGKGRVAIFARSDLTVLEQFMAHFHHHLTTPNVLTEINSFLGQLSGNLRERCREQLRSDIEILAEQHVDSRRASQQDAFLRFGLTDCGIHLLAMNACLVLTDDFALSQYLDSKGLAALNFHHIRLAGMS
jgi:hypothetical protein